jgi:hypothetical protein
MSEKKFINLYAKVGLVITVDEDFDERNRAKIIEEAAWCLANSEYSEMEVEDAVVVGP